MNAKTTFCICCAVLLVGCSTTNRAVTDNTIVEYSRQLAVLENGIEQYGESVAAVRADIAAVCEGLRTVREGASSIGSTIEDTIVLFDAYQRAVERLLQDYDRLRDQAATAYARNSGAIDCTID